MGILAQRHKIELKGAQAYVTKVMGEDPRRIVEIIIKIKMPKSDFSDKEKKILEKVIKNCPIGNTLGENVKKSVQVEY